MFLLLASLSVASSQAKKMEFWPRNQRPLENPAQYVPSKVFAPTSADLKLSPKCRAHLARLLNEEKPVCKGKKSHGSVHIRKQSLADNERYGERRQSSFPFDNCKERVYKPYQPSSLSPDRLPKIARSKLEPTKVLERQRRAELVELSQKLDRIERNLAKHEEDSILLPGLEKVSPWEISPEKRRFWRQAQIFSSNPSLEKNWKDLSSSYEEVSDREDGFYSRRHKANLMRKYGKEKRAPCVVSPPRQQNSRAVFKLKANRLFGRPLLATEARDQVNMNKQDLQSTSPQMVIDASVHAKTKSEFSQSPISVKNDEVQSDAGTFLHFLERLRFE